MQLFDITLVIEDCLCGMCADLVYKLEGDKFLPVGGIKLTDDQFFCILDGDTSFLKFSMLRPPLHHFFEYKYNNITYTYIHGFLFEYNGQQMKRHAIDYEFVNLGQKFIQHEGTVYGFAGLQLNTR